MAAPTDYSSSMGYGSISDYSSAGMIVLFAVARGREAGAPAGVTDFKAAETKQDYINALNANGEWVSWDEKTGEVTITSVSAFTSALKNASKSIAAFDQLDRGQGENTLFGYGDGNGHRNAAGQRHHPCPF